MPNHEYVEPLVKSLIIEYPHVPENCLLELAEIEVELYLLSRSATAGVFIDTHKFHNLPPWLILAHETLADKSIQWETSPQLL